MFLWPCSRSINNCFLTRMCEGGLRSSEQNQFSLQQWLWETRATIANLLRLIQKRSWKRLGQMRRISGTNILSCGVQFEGYREGEFLTAPSRSLGAELLEYERILPLELIKQRKALCKIGSQIYQGSNRKLQPNYFPSLASHLRK